MRKLLLLCTCILLMGRVLPVIAACGLPASSASFGGVSSFTVNTTASTGTVNINVNCGGGGILTLLSTNTITFRLTSASTSTGNRGTLTAGTDAIPVQLCYDAACATELTIGGRTLTYSYTQLVNLIGLLGGTNFTIPFYLRTVPGAAIAAGTYTVTLNMLVNYDICTGIGLLGLCIGEQIGSGIVPITLTIAISNDCTTITTQPVNFGNAPLVSSFNIVNQTLSVICTKGSVYTVGISNGLYNIGNQRYMSNGSNRMAYQIYQGSGTTYWGPTTSDRVASTASTSISTDLLTRTFSFNAQVLLNQSTPQPGNYTDTVTVDLSF